MCGGTPPRAKEVLGDRVRFLERGQLDFDEKRWHNTSLSKTAPCTMDLLMYSLERERVSKRSSSCADPGFNVDINCPSKTTAFFARSILTLLGRYSIGVYLRRV